MRTKEEILAEIELMKTRLAEIRAESVSAAYYETMDVRRDLQITHNVINRKIPIRIEGFVGTDTEEIDSSEHSRTVEEYIYLGCPVILRSVSSGKTRASKSIIYEEDNDLTKIVTQHMGKYLRITIEELGVEDREKCTKCEKRFVCLTSI